MRTRSAFLAAMLLASGINSARAQSPRGSRAARAGRVATMSRIALREAALASPLPAAGTPGPRPAERSLRAHEWLNLLMADVQNGLARIWRCF